MSRQDPNKRHIDDNVFRVTAPPSKNQAPEPKRKRRGRPPKEEEHVKMTHMFRPEQLEQIRMEASYRGFDSSQMVRYIVDEYYHRFPLSVKRLRAIMEERLTKDAQALEPPEAHQES